MLETMYREIEALGGAPIMDAYDEGHRDALEAALAVLRKHGFGVDLAPGPDEERHILTMDNDGHWYVIPVAKQPECGAWLDIASDDERAWEEPDFAKRVGGAPCLVTFTNPEIS